MAERRFYRDAPSGAGLQDPRDVAAQQPYSPRIQGDVETQTRNQQNSRDAPSIGEIYDALRAKQVPAQVNYVPRFANITKVNVPVLLAPKNPRRVSFIISNYNAPSFYSVGTATVTIAKKGVNGVVFSYDQPQQFLSPAGVWVNNFAGIPLAAGATWIENNGAVSINDIWVVCNDVNSLFPFTIAAYEGQLSIVGNKR